MTVKTGRSEVVYKTERYSVKWWWNANRKEQEKKLAVERQR